MGIVSAIAAMRIQQRAKAKEVTEKIQIQYLNPLLVAATDFRERLEEINERMARGDNLLSHTIQELKNRVHADVDFASWVNSVGHFALSTLYITSVYFAHASKIRTDLPFVKLRSGDDRMLLDNLGCIRRSLGGEFGIWDNLQDSFGSYVRRHDGSIVNYREFGAFFCDDHSFPWFLRLIDFYRDIDRKLPEQRDEMVRSLKHLEAFLEKK